MREKAGAPIQERLAFMDLCARFPLLSAKIAAQCFILLFVDFTPGETLSQDLQRGIDIRGSGDDRLNFVSGAIAVKRPNRQYQQNNQANEYQQFNQAAEDQKEIWKPTYPMHLIPPNKTAPLLSCWKTNKLVQQDKSRKNRNGCFV